MVHFAVCKGLACGVWPLLVHSCNQIVEALSDIKWVSSTIGKKELIGFLLSYCDLQWLQQCLLVYMWLEFVGSLLNTQKPFTVRTMGVSCE